MRFCYKFISFIIFAINIFIPFTETFSSPLLVYQGNIQSIDIDHGQRVNIFITDWDNDGKKDIIIGLGTTKDIIWYKNYGGSPVPTLSYGGLILTDTKNTSPVVVDWNNDGKKDIIAGTDYGQIRKYINTGTDTNPLFSSAATIDSSGNGQPLKFLDLTANPWVADWNNDGKKDLIVGYGTGSWSASCSVFLNEGTDDSPSFSTSSIINVSSNNWNLRPVVIDWNNDKRKDIIFSVLYNIKIAENSGSDTVPSFPSSSILTVGGSSIDFPIPVFCSVCDWNNDGKKDVLWGDDEYGNIYFAENTGTDTVPSFGYNPITLVALPHNISKANSIFLFDWESDNDIDIIAGLMSGAPAHIIYRNMGSQLSPTYTAYGFVKADGTSVTGSWSSYATRGVYDYDNDGLYDFLRGDNNGMIRYYKNIGTNQSPIFMSKGDLKVGGSDIDVGGLSVPRICDWNNDGKNDLISGSYDGNLYLFLNTNTNDSPVYGSTVLFYDTSGLIDVGFSATPWIFDWDGDGRKDIIVGNSTGNIYLYLSSGSDTLLYNAGTLKNADGNPINYGINATPVFIDWDYDSKQDMIVCGNNNIFLLLNKEPNSSVSILALEQTSLSFTVSWSGSAYKGVKSYDMQYKDGDAGLWIDWLTNTSAMSGTFTGQNGHTYYFRSRVKDNSDNYESYPLTADAYTTINVDYEKTKITNLSAKTGNSEGEIILTWTAVMNPVNNAIPISSYKIKYSKINIASSDFDNQQDIPVTPPVALNYGETHTFSVSGLTPGEFYYFAVRPTDTLSNNLSMSNIASARSYTKYRIDVVIQPSNPNSVKVSNPDDTGTFLEIPPYAVSSEVVISLIKRSNTDLTSEQVSSAKRSPDIRDANALAVYDVIVSDTQGDPTSNYTFLKAVRFDIRYQQPNILLDEQYLSVFKWDGYPWTKEGGIRDTDKNLITVYESSFSRFAVFVEKEKKDRAYPEFCTPNSDNINDRIFFTFKSSGTKPVEIWIYNLDGKIIKRIDEAISGNTYWDGRDSLDKMVETGVYIYRIISDSVFTGTVYVAK